MQTLLQDIRYAVRALRKAPAFTLVAVLTLALGIGANSTIFSVVNGVLLQPLPYAQPERLVMVWGHHTTIGREVASQPDYLDWRADNTVFSDMAALAHTSFDLTGVGEPERLNAALTTANFFRTLGTTPLLGRAFLDREEKTGANQVAILSYGFWQRRFGGSPGIVGQTITLSGLPYTVVGVAPAGFRFERDVDIWAPLRTDVTRSRRGDFLTVIGRLKPGVTFERAQTEMTTIAARLTQQYPETNTNWSVELVPLKEQLVGAARPALLIFMGAVGLVLLIACANVANLMLTRAAAREREMAIRATLGAGQGRLIRQMLTESVLVSLVGGALGLLLALWGVAALQGVQSSLIPRLGEVGIDGWVLGFTLLLSVLTGVLFGLAPALRVGRGELHGSLREGARGASAGMGVRQLRGALVLAEVALALVLLVGAGLLIKSFDRLQRVDPGFTPDHVLTAQIVLPGARYGEEARQRAFYSQLLDALRSAPGVQGAAVATDVPLSGGANYLSFSIAGQADPGPGVVQDAEVFVASPDYFHVLGIPLRQGRLFTEQDGAGAPNVVVINHAMAQRYWPGRDPLGARITLGDPADSAGWRTVVGVIGGVRHNSLDADPYPQMFAPVAQMPRRAVMVLARTAGDPVALTGTLRRAVTSLDTNLPVSDVMTMEARVSRSVAQPRVNVTLLGLFAAVALLLAAVGIYGGVSYSVVQRTRELGIRMALGARPGDVLRLVVRQAMAPALVGVAVGLVGAWAGTRLMASLLFGVSTSDPAVFAAVALFLAGVALLASYIPARRATRVDPLVALQYE
jgi:putative ABC transport system permease protein